MLWSRNRLKVVGIIALETADKLGAQRPCQERIFSERFLSPSPAGIAQDVDIGRPDGQAEIAVVIAFALGLVVAGATLDADGVAFSEKQLPIPGGSHTDGLRENGRFPTPSDTVQ